MMLHFAYPNVIPRDARFLGCGRYIASPLDEPPNDAYQLVELNIPNIAEVHLTALQLAPESAESKLVIYERRDSSGTHFRGSSQDIAYVLALISRTRTPVFELTEPPGDIWCTGSLALVGDVRPFLNAVDFAGFTCKLEAFLAEDNPDRLFIVPAQNVLPTHEVLFQRHNLRVLSLSAFQRLFRAERLSEKTILKVQGHELDELVSTLFEPPGILPALRPDSHLPALNPYLGLFAFHEEDADVFFGREAYITHILNALQHDSWLTIIGASGIGKSSLIHAGVIPRLRQQANWLIASLRPGSVPFSALANVLISFLEPHRSETERLIEVKKMSARLRSGELNLTDIFRAIHAKFPEKRLFLCLDQCEELYTQCRDDSCRHQFIDELLSATSPAEQADGFLVVLWALRADFLGKACAYRPLADRLQQANLMLGPMNQEELRTVIEEPARQCGVQLEEGLTERILEAVCNAPGHLPLLEFALTQLWEQGADHLLTHAAYARIGGVQRALAEYAEGVYRALPLEEQQQARRILIQLIHPGQGTEDTRRRATRAEIGDENWRLVIKLADARLVVTSIQQGSLQPPREASPPIQEEVELVHEALISGWQRLQEWMETERDFRIWQERIRAARMQWETSGCDTDTLLRGSPLAEAEQWLATRAQFISRESRQFIELSARLRRRRRSRRYLAFFAGFAMMALIAVFSFIAWRMTDTLRWKAEIRAIELLNQSSHALFLSRENDLDALLYGIKAAQRASQHNLPISLKNQITLNLWQIVYGIHEKNRLEGHDGSVCDLVFSPDGHILASGSNDRSIKLWRVATGEEIASLQGHLSAIKSLALTADGTLLASGSSDATIKLWDFPSGRLNATLYGHTGAVRSLDFNPAGTLLASGSDDHVIHLWNLRTHETVATLAGHQDEVQDTCFHPDKPLLASAGNDDRIMLWNVETGQHVAVLVGHQNGVRSLSFSPDGQRLASGGNDHSIKVWDVATQQELATLSGHTDTIRSVRFSPDGRLLASGSDEFDNTVKLWDAATFQEIRTFRGHYNSTRSVRFSPNGLLLASGSDDYTIRLWSVEQLENSAVLRGHSGFVKSVAFSPDGTMLASGSSDSTIKLWDVVRRREITTLQGHTEAVWSLRFSPNGMWIASGSQDRSIKLWDVAQQREHRTFLGHTGTVWSVDISPDNRLLASGSEDSSIKVWRSADGREIASLDAHLGAVRSVRFHPRGTLLASGGYDYTVRLWELAPPSLRMTLSEHFLPVFSVDFSPDGSLLASGSWDNTAKLWRLPDGQKLHTLKRHSRTLLSVDFSPDGTMLASSSQDTTVKLWDVGSGREIATLSGHDKSVKSVTFAPDGKLLASGSDDYTIRLWNIGPDDLLVQGCLWIYGYLQNNPHVSPTDREVCDEILDLPLSPVKRE